ncbi:hypothetical protein K443DRAFT_127960 [Laccaria amethystina LaAM-08-1]|uniref:Uncharacterized protein n=1 Tax=Laccaria amethystina LaAM-08-1 TaxID=1095629 RepID=A0A0C9X9S0_9AGAR|nr:hypothetical protein K443DRAFT_127960 [Laccaria amethystina LaAM-08-1]
MSTMPNPKHHYHQLPYSYPTPRVLGSPSFWSNQHLSSSYQSTSSFPRFMPSDSLPNGSLAGRLAMSGDDQPDDPSYPLNTHSQSNISSPYLSGSSVPPVPNNSLPNGSQGGRLIISSNGPTDQPSYTLNTNTQPNQDFFWPSAPNGYDADVNLGPANAELSKHSSVTNIYLPIAKLHLYRNKSCVSEAKPHIFECKPYILRAKPQLFSSPAADTHQPNFQFFCINEPPEYSSFLTTFLDLPMRAYGPFVPQQMYKPHTNSDRKRYVEEIELEAPIYFSMDHPSEFGIPLSDALHSRVKRLQNRDQLVFEGRGPSVSIRLEWPGYRQWSRQIPTKDFRTPPGPITLSKLAKNVAKCVQRFIEERKNQSLEDDSDPRWKVGTGANHIKLEDLVLVSIHHVSLALDDNWR